MFIHIKYIFHHFGPITSSWPPKQHFLNIFSNFLQISAFYSTITWTLSHKTTMEFVHDTQEYILKEYFPHIFYQFGPMTSSWPRKTALFGHFYHFSLMTSFWPQNPQKCCFGSQDDAIGQKLWRVLGRICSKIIYKVLPTICNRVLWGNTCFKVDYKAEICRNLLKSAVFGKRWRHS